MSAGRVLRLIALVIAVICVATTSSPGEAQESTGRLNVWAYDGFSGKRIGSPCVTVTLPGDTTPIEPVDGRYPVGTYDVLVEDCEGIYQPVLWESVDIGPWDAIDGTPVLTTFLAIEDRAAISGRVSDAYSGYPLKGINVRLYALDGTPLDYVATDKFGIYQLFAEPDVPVLVRINGYGNTHYQNQWYPYSKLRDEAIPVTPRLGTHVVANGALEVNGGFVGRIVDTDDPRAGIPDCLVRAWSGGARGYSYSRNDGSFTVDQRGPSVTLEVQCEGNEGGLLADPDRPSTPLTWNVTSGDSVDVGWIAMDREPTVSGRVVDGNGYPVDGAEIRFLGESQPFDEYATVGYTDAMGYYVTNEPLDGSHTAFVQFFAEQNGLTRADHFNPTWLGGSRSRENAVYLDYDGDNRGGVDIRVERGETYRNHPPDFDRNGPQWLTTDVERDGATTYEPLEVAAYVDGPFAANVGTFFDPISSHPGFTSAGFSATVTHHPLPGSDALTVEFRYEPSLLPAPIDDLQMVWNGRMLRSCSLVAAPCETSRSTDSRGDHVITATVPSGGVASLLWGPRFLDTGVSIFLADIEWLADEGVTKGCSPPINDFYCPKDQVTRGQMAAFLVRFLGLTDRGETDFADDDGSVFEADIEKLAAAGITRGCNPPTNDRFCPNDPVTRGQMAAFLTRALELPAATGIDFTDDDGSIFEDAIERLAAAGITRGCNPPANDRFCPTATVTREQMAAFLHRAGELRP
ncbi:MAG: S-layer homology domain-containing protein [Acidimicrobiia bacterium]|nr:S-layer homology domain-containing protein [Acidimicrobiia bacterium]